MYYAGTRKTSLKKIKKGMDNHPRKNNSQDGEEDMHCAIGMSEIRAHTIGRVGRALAGKQKMIPPDGKHWEGTESLV